jgi:vancomycin permeability regulator SanA
MRKLTWKFPLSIGWGEGQGEGRNWLKNALPRGLALFLGGFSLLNLLGNFHVAGFDANLWWIDLRALPNWLGNALLFVSAFTLLAFGLRPPQSRRRKALTISCASVLGIIATANALGFYVLAMGGSIDAGLPIPFSLFVCCALALILRVTVDPKRSLPLPIRWEEGRGEEGLLTTAGFRNLLRALAVCLACVVIFPFAQMLCFGKTDYRRPADVAVVLGARVYADGRPSDALADRVRTACKLYRNGTVKKLLFSGGPGDGSVHETEGMKRMALQLGVKPDDILLDAQGVNTQATVKNTEAIFQQLHASRILVVSHFYHLPRIKLAYHREGREVYTVPAKESYLLRQMPYNMAREVAALWVYYFRPLAGRHAVAV